MARVSTRVAKALKSTKKLEHKGRTLKFVKVVGHVEGGKLHIDYEEIAAIRKEHPSASIAFVALNAPFKTKAPTGSL